MSITDVKYQDAGIDRFQQALGAARMSHAYVFVGPSGIGKTTTARELAKMLLCDQPVEIARPASGGARVWRDSCGTCPSCRLVVADNHPDLHRVYKELIGTVPGKESHKATELGIDVIRQEVIDKVGRKPTVGTRKIFIIQEAELLSRSAQNALLKTLEEPPSNTYLFLISEKMTVLLPTIRSRAQVLVFQMLPEEFIVERLTAAGASGPEARFLARFVPGKLGSALDLYQLKVYDLSERLGKDLAALDPTGADDFAQWVLDEAKALTEKMLQKPETGELKARSSESELTRTAIKLILALIGGFYRDSLRLQLGFAAETLLNREWIKTVQALAERDSTDRTREKILSLGETEKWIDANVNVTLAVTDVVNKMI